MKGINNRFGWTSSFRIVQNDDNPPDMDNLLCWYNNSNGYRFNDKMDIVNPEPIVKNIPCLQFIGEAHIDTHAHESAPAVNVFGACTIFSTVYLFSDYTTAPVHTFNTNSYKVAPNSGVWEINDVNTSIPIITNKWLYIEADYDENGNGIELRVSDGNILNTWTGNAVPDASGNGGFIIGGMYDSTVYFKGKMKGVSISNDQGTWNMEETTGEIVYDSSSQGNHGDIVGSTDITVMRNSIINEVGNVETTTDGYIREHAQTTGDVNSLEFACFIDELATSGSSEQIILTFDWQGVVQAVLGQKYQSTTYDPFRFGQYDNNYSYITDIISPGCHVFKLVWNVDRYDIYIDNELKPTFIKGVPIKFTEHQICFGRKGTSGAFYPRKFYYVKLNDEVMLEYDHIWNLDYDATVKRNKFVNECNVGSSNIKYGFTAGYSFLMEANQYGKTEPITLGDKFELYFDTMFKVDGSDKGGFSNTKFNTEPGGVTIAAAWIGDQANLILYPNGAPDKTSIVLNERIYNGERHTVKLTYDNGDYAIYVNDVPDISGTIDHYNGFDIAKSFYLMNYEDLEHPTNGSLFAFKVKPDGASELYTPEYTLYNSPMIIFLPNKFGTELDVLGHTLSNIGGLLHNNASRIHISQDENATNLIDKIQSNDGNTAIYDGVINGKPKFVYNNGYTIEHNGAESWQYTDGTGTVLQSVTSDTLYPTKKGWSGGLELSYDSNWITDSGALRNRSYKMLLNDVNFTGEEITKWIKQPTGHCGLKEMLNYKQGTVENFSQEDYDKAIEFIGDSNCVSALSPLMDVNGDIIYDNSGEIIWVN